VAQGAQKKKVLTVSTDVYRPAAIEQLKTVSAQAGIDFFPSTPDRSRSTSPAAALDYAKRHYMDVLLVDTAGRLAIDEAMMAEIKALHARSSRSKPCSWSMPCSVRMR
jgi:signal recognition particle subunit SRP54